jgi:hypothetical protein
MLSKKLTGWRVFVSRKHNVKHIRSRSHYPERLAARGVSSRSVKMIDFVPVPSHPTPGFEGKRPTQEQLDRVAFIRHLNFPIEEAS